MKPGDLVVYESPWTKDNPWMRYPQYFGLLLKVDGDMCSVLWHSNEVGNYLDDTLSSSLLKVLEPGGKMTDDKNTLAAR